MKKLVSCAVMAALIFALAGGIFMPLEPVKANMCVFEPEPFKVYGGDEPTEPCKGILIPAYECLGYWDGTSIPCFCTFLGCVPPKPGPDSPGSPGGG